MHAGLRCRPSQRIDADMAAMLPLPPVLPDVDWHTDTRLSADHRVRIDTNDYSVHPAAIGRRIHKTTRRYDHARHALNRHATYAIAHYLAGGT